MPINYHTQSLWPSFRPSSSKAVLDLKEEVFCGEWKGRGIDPCIIFQNAELTSSFTSKPLSEKLVPFLGASCLLWPHCAGHCCRAMQRWLAHSSLSHLVPTSAPDCFLPPIACHIPVLPSLAKKITAQLPKTDVGVIFFSALQ